VRVHPVHLTHAAQALGGRRPFDQASDPPKLAAVVLHSPSPFITTQPMEGRRLSRPSSASRQFVSVKHSNFTR